MDFRISDTFTDSLSKLSGDEQKAVKTTAFDLQMNPANPGMQFHKLTRAKDKDFWSVRVNDGIRLIVHRTNNSLLLCYVDQHDDAYRWAERRKIERHPTTGAAQLVEIRETVREISIPRYIETDEPAAPIEKAPPRKMPAAQPLLFSAIGDEELLGYGVPTEWLADVRTATEDTLLGLTDHLPREASEALLDLATGAKPNPPQKIALDADAFAHPDAQRRFRVMTNVEELQQALEYPWEKWTVFLHPAQRELVERHYSGPVRVSGSAGTGKTIVALHRAVHLARKHPADQVLLTTFSPTLARFLKHKLLRLIGNDPAVVARIDVLPIAEVGRRVHIGLPVQARIVDDATLTRLIREAAAAVPDHKYSEAFLRAEWDDVVDAWQVTTWEQYRDVARLGRKTRLSEKQRQILWSIFERIRTQLRTDSRITRAGVFFEAAAALGGKPSPYRFAVVDESQDITVAQLRFLAAIAGGRPDSLFFTGDLGQRIFQTPFSWKSLGVDIRGRSHTLRINYRTSHQIRRQSDRLLPASLADVDGNAEQRRGTVSVFNGAEPEIAISHSVGAEAALIAKWIKARVADGVRPEEIGVFVRSSDQISRAENAVRLAGHAAVQLDSGSEPADGKIAIATMHLAKGLEFRAVVVAAVDDGVVPLESRIEAITDEADLAEVYTTERHLLYVACTRARDHLLITAVNPVSEFLDDLKDTST